MNTFMDTNDDVGRLVEDAARKVLQSHGSAETLKAAEGSWCAALWDDLSSAGLTRALEPPGRGDMGLPVADALAIIRLAGSFAAPVPLAENFLANWLLQLTGLEPVAGPWSIAPVRSGDRLSLSQHGSGWQLRGSVGRVPWGRFAQGVVVVAERGGESVVVPVPRESFTDVVHGENLAREPRDTLVVELALGNDVVRPFPGGADHLFRLGAAMRVLQMAGAMESVLRMTVDYVMQRKQFGKPLGKFQAVQQNIAVMAANVAATKAAANSACHQFTDEGTRLGIAAAKLRTNEAATIVSKLAHQAHGAMGFTQEYGLHFLTKRLWSWRDEFGNDALWSRQLGEAVCTRGADDLWTVITAEMG